MAFLSSVKGDGISKLEAALAKMQQQVARVDADRATHRDALAGLGERLGAATLNGEDVTAMDAEHASLERRLRSLDIAEGQGQAQIATLLQQLEAAKTREARKASHDALMKGRKEIEAAWRDLRPALERMTAALAASSYRPLLNETQDYLLAAHTLTNARAVCADGAAVSNVIRAAEVLAGQIVDGERDFNLGAPVAVAEEESRRITRETNVQMTHEANARIIAARKAVA